MANSYLFGPSTKVGVNYGQIRLTEFSYRYLFARIRRIHQLKSASNQGVPSFRHVFPEFRGGGKDLDQFITLSEPRNLSEYVKYSAACVQQDQLRSFPIDVGSLAHRLNVYSGRPFGSFSLRLVIATQLWAARPSSLRTSILARSAYQRGRHACDSDALEQVR